MIFFINMIVGLFVQYSWKLLDKFAGGFLQNHRHFPEKVDISWKALIKLILTLKSLTFRTDIYIFVIKTKVLVHFKLPWQLLGYLIQ